MSIDVPTGRPRVDRALAVARADARERWSKGQWSFGQPDGRPRRRRLAIGDPQAPMAKLLAILDRHAALGDDGLLAEDVLLVSMGDHFDWGGAAGPHTTPDALQRSRAQAADDGLAFLGWLAGHPADQVIILAGNHDLGRVGELAGYDDDRFLRVQAAADELYRTRPRLDDEDQAAFGSAHGIPTAEIAARDFSTFRAIQAAMVEALLRTGRMRIAWASAPDVLFTHAGVTRADLGSAGLTERDHTDARLVAEALERALHTALATWSSGALALPRLHEPGTPGKEGRGIFFHRPSNQSGGKDRGHPELFDGPARRRFDPRDLPLGLAQVIGHIHDAKCRELLGDWADGAQPSFGPLRELVTDGREVRYATGVRKDTDPALARMVFLDGKAHEAGVDVYELLDLDPLQPARP